MGWRRIVVAASGPSFTVDQAEQIESARAAGVCHVIAINATGMVPDPGHGRPVGLPNADSLYGADTPFWDQYGARLQATFRGQMWTRDKPSAVRFGLKHIPCNTTGKGLTKDLGRINGGGNSGHAGTQLGYLKSVGAGAEMALCGFDMKLAPDGRAHHHGSHEGRLANPSPDALKEWCLAFDQLARDLARANVHVWNVTIASALKCFAPADLTEVLERWRCTQA